MKSVLKVLVVITLSALALPLLGAKKKNSIKMKSASAAINNGNNKELNKKDLKSKKGKLSKYDQRLNQLEAQISQLREMLIQQGYNNSYNNPGNNTDTINAALVTSDITAQPIAEMPTEPIFIDSQSNGQQIAHNNAYYAQPRMGPAGTLVEGTINTAGAVSDAAVGTAVNAVDRAGEIVTFPIRAIVG